MSAELSLSGRNWEHGIAIIQWPKLELGSDVADPRLLQFPNGGLLRTELGGQLEDEMLFGRGHLLASSALLDNALRLNRQ